MASRVVEPAFTATRLGNPQHRGDCWHHPSLVNLLRLQWRYPWIDSADLPAEPDRSIWGTWLNVRAITGEADPAFVKAMMNYALPLRAGLAVVNATADMSVDSVFAEIFLQPWGTVGAVTVTFAFEPSKSLPDAAAHAEEFRDSAQLSIGVGAATHSGAPDSVAEALASSGAEALGSGDGTARTVAPGIVVATVIAANLEDPFEDLTLQPMFAQSLYRLAGTVSPGLPLKWLKLWAQGPACPTGDVRTPLPSGIAQWAQGALISTPAEPRMQTNGVHRNAVARLAMLSFLHGLLGSTSSSSDSWLTDLRTTYQQLLGRLYGPAPCIHDWTGQAYVQINGLEHLLLQPQVKVSWWCP